MKQLGVICWSVQWSCRWSLVNTAQTLMHTRDSLNKKRGSALAWVIVWVIGLSGGRRWDLRQHKNIKIQINVLMQVSDYINVAF